MRHPTPQVLVRLTPHNIWPVLESRRENQQLAMGFPAGCWGLHTTPGRGPGRCSHGGLRSPMLPSHSWERQNLAGKAGKERGCLLSRKELEHKLRPRGHSRPQLLQLLRLPVPAAERVPEDAPAERQEPCPLPAAEATADSARWGGAGLAGAPSPGPRWGDFIYASRSSSVSPV